MRKSTVKVICLCICLWDHGQSAAAQQRDAISAIPRVDVHSHVGSVERMGHYIKVAEVLKNRHDINLAVWIDLNFMRRPDGTEQEYLDAAAGHFKGRFLPCINDFKISDGLRFSGDELVKWQEKGIVGYKIWVGVSPLIDVPANDATFTKMEEIGMIGASVHIAQPCPTRWCEDPVKFWQAQNAWERVLDRHPKLKVVNAHMLDHFNSNEQLDYLRYVLETYPNVHVDLGARFQQFHHIQTLMSTSEHAFSSSIEWTETSSGIS
ncbi:MAG: amidohydrolase family protein [Planctomycetota bacterium]